MLIHGVNKLINGIGFIEGRLSGMGFRARLVALVLAFNMVVAVGLVHMKQLFTLGDRGGYALELQAFYLAQWLSS